MWIFFSCLLNFNITHAYFTPILLHTILFRRENLLFFYSWPFLVGMMVKISPFSSFDGGLSITFNERFLSVCCVTFFAKACAQSWRHLSSDYFCLAFFDFSVLLLLSTVFLLCVFSVLCLLRWRWWDPLLLKFLEHIVHWNGCFPEWIIMWSFKRLPLG